MKINSIQNYQTQNYSNVSCKGIKIPQNRSDITARMSHNTIASLRKFDTISVMQKIMPAIMQKFCDEAEIIVEGMIKDMGLKPSAKVKKLITNAIRNKAYEILENAKKDKKTSDFNLSVGQYYWEEKVFGGGRDACGGWCEAWTATHIEFSSDSYTFRNNNFPIPFFVKGSRKSFKENGGRNARDDVYYLNHVIDTFRTLLDPECEKFKRPYTYIIPEDKEGNQTYKLLIKKLIKENAELNEILNNLQINHKTKKLLKENPVINVMLTDEQKGLVTAYPYKDTKVVEVPPLCDKSDTAFRNISILCS